MSFRPWIATVVLLLVLLVFVGCQKEQQKTEYNRASFPIELNASDVLVRIGSNEFTKADFTKSASLQIRVFELANKHIGRKLNTSMVEIRAFSNYPRQMELETAFAIYAATSGVVVTRADTNEARKVFQKSCGNEMLQWKTFAGKFPNCIRAELNAEIGRIALRTAIRREFLEKNPVSVSDKEFSECGKWIADYNARASTTNAAIWAMASNVWTNVKKGEVKFEEAANKYTQDESEPENGEWDSFKLEAFSDDPILSKTISEMKTGDVSTPVEGDNGLMILKLVGIEPPEKKGDAPRYILSRIFFRLPEFYETVSSERLREEMLSTKQNIEFSKFVKSLTSEIKTEIVCDKKFFEQARQALKNPMAGMMQ